MTQYYYETPVNLWVKIGTIQCGDQYWICEADPQ